MKRCERKHLLILKSCMSLKALHDFLQTKEDIHNWWPKIRPGGMLGGSWFNSAVQHAPYICNFEYSARTKFEQLVIFLIAFINFHAKPSLYNVPSLPAGHDYFSALEAWPGQDWWVSLLRVFFLFTTVSIRFNSCYN